MRMRLFIDTLVAVTLVWVLGGIALHSHRANRMEQRVELVRNELRRIQSQITLQAAMERVPLTRHGYPATIDVAWFGDFLPCNPLLEAGHDLVDYADESQAEADHPRNRVASGLNVAQFWYNPYKGLVRARVPDNVSDTTALRLYNRVNDCNLTSILD